MGKIKILPKSVYSKIQAGEIIEDPSSVIRELVDNSYDAGAGNIKIFLEENGLDKITVVDDGEGIDPGDMKKIFLNHATSKIKDEEDLFSIRTLGFRGEALHAISNISRFICRSCSGESSMGFELQVFGGVQQSFEPVAMNRGTYIEVKELFYNTPARKKFLPSKQTVLKSVKTLINQKACACFDANFELYNNGKLVFSYEKNSFFERLEEVYGNNRISQLGKLNIHDLNSGDSGEKSAFSDFLTSFGVKEIYLGFSRKDFYSKYGTAIGLFVNHRAVAEDYVEKQVKRFYYSVYPRGYYPYFYLYVIMDPSLMDQNIDPTKKQIKIHSVKEFSESLLSILKKYFYQEAGYKNLDFRNDSVLNQSKSFPVNGETSSKSKNFSFSFDRDNYFSGNQDENIFSSSGPVDTKEIVVDREGPESEFEETVFKLDREMEKVKDREKINPGTELMKKAFSPAGEGNARLITRLGRYIGLLFETYLMFEDRDILILIDFHAGYESINYKILMEKDSGKRNLLFPELIEFSIAQDRSGEKTEEMIEKIRSLDFDLELLSIGKLQLISVPQSVNTKDLGLIKEELGNAFSDQRNFDFEQVRKKLYSGLACRMSPKAHDALSYIDVRNFVELWASHGFPDSCPHGRPVVIKFEKEFFDKKFLRKK